MSSQADAPTGERGRRAPVMELAVDSMRVVLPLKRTRNRLVRGWVCLGISAIGGARVLFVAGRMLIGGTPPAPLLFFTLLEVFYQLWAVPFLIVGAYALWGREILTVAAGRASVRYELWSTGYQHSQVVLAPGSTVEVAAESGGGAHVVFHAFRAGAGHRRADLAFGKESLEPADARQIADRAEALMSLWAGGAA